jgi:peptidoglycan/LPS O-acetylase OafA/YrhL
VVFFGHFYYTYPEALRSSIDLTNLQAWLEPWIWLRYTPLRLLVSGGAAVIVFFVLSGFVLALPFLDDSQPSYSRYVVKRFFRIWPPFAVAILLSAALHVAIAPTPIGALSEWFNVDSWNGRIDGWAVLRHLVMTGMRADQTLDTPMWSLVHELRISLIFPLLVMLVRSGPLRALAIAAAINAACALALTHIREESVAGTLLATGRYVLFFVAGIIMASHRPLLASFLRLPLRARAALWCAAALALLFPASLSAFAHLSWGIGAVLIIGLSLNSRTAERALSLRVPLWLGRVSYSFYLIHVPLLMAAVQVLYGLAPLWLILAGALSIALISAELMFRYVEAPSIGIGVSSAAALARLPELRGAG